MVVFNCNACGDSLKKNQVEKHYMTKCRRCEVLSCVDCSKEFWGESYKEHVKCISEEEKYSGKNYKPKANANKGEKKQELWTEQVQSAIENSSSSNPKLTSTLRSIMDFPNIPRKKAKFENFMKNSMRVRETYIITQCWDALSAEMNKQSQATAASAQETNEKPNTESQETSIAETETKEDIKLKKKSKKDKKKKERSAEEDSDTGKSKKRKIKEDKKKKKKTERIAEDESENESADTNGRLNGTLDNDSANSKFKLEKTIIDLLTKKEDGMSIKKLRKKVLREFAACGGDGKGSSEEHISAKLNKKLKKDRRFKVLKDNVTLV